MEPQKILMMFPDMNSEELYSVQAMMQSMTTTEQDNFLFIYKSKRRDKTLMLVLALVGFVGVAGVHRLITGDILLGVLYFFTAGLCFVGTIVDLINIENIALKYNLSQAAQAASLVKMMNQSPRQYGVN
jgi:TM2 domain-containing membrane protein YozV